MFSIRSFFCSDDLMLFTLFLTGPPLGVILVAHNSERLVFLFRPACFFGSSACLFSRRFLAWASRSSVGKIVGLLRISMQSVTGLNSIQLHCVNKVKPI